MSLNNIEKNLIFNLSAPRIFRHVEKLCDFGPRYIGSEAVEKTLSYLETELAKYGAEIERCPFEISHFEEVKSEVKILLPQEITFPCRAHYRSTSTPKDGIIADKVVYVGSGTEEELHDKNLKGVIVLTQDGRLHLPNLLDNVHKRGAVGCIVVRRNPDDLISTVGLHRYGSPIAAVSIHYQDGQLLKDFVSKGSVKIFMNVQTRLEPKNAHNLLGVLMGQEKPDEVWVIVAHYESVPTTLGANDNAVGVALALEMLHAFSTLPLTRTLWVIFSTGEEGGMMGMFDFVEQRKKELGKIQGLINLDVIGRGTTLWAIKAGELIPGVELTTSKRLNQTLLRAAQDLGYQLDNTNTIPAAGFGLADAHPFAEAGVPVAWLRKGGDGANAYGHTSADTPDTIDINALKIPADILALSLLRLDKEQV